MVTALIMSATGFARAADAPDAGIGFASPAEAMAALRLSPNVKFSVVNGWTVADDAVSHKLWTFAPATDPAYPSVVSRQIVVKGNDVSIDMRISCGASEPACEKLVADYQALNDKVKERLATLPGHTKGDD